MLGAVETDFRNVGIIGDQSEALLLSVLFAEAGVSSTLAGPFEPLSGRVYGSPLEQARRLLGLHMASRSIEVVNGPDSLRFSTLRNIVLTAHVRDSQAVSSQERIIRTVSRSISRGTNIVITGLCRPGYTATVSSLIERMGGSDSGADFGLCYLPLLWDGEALQAFRETPRILASSNSETIASVQELFLKLFPSLSSVTNTRAAEAAGLFVPVVREVSSALQLELAGLCVGEGVDYYDALGLCRGTGLLVSGTRRMLASRGSIASEIAVSLGGNRSGPSLIRTARRVNLDLDRRIMVMVKGALARCGLRVRHSRVAVLGLDGLGINSGLRPGSIGLLEALNRRGAIVSVYPGSTVGWTGDGVLGKRVSVERSIAKAVEKAQCAVVALGGLEVGELNPHRIAAEMSRPAALCDLTGVLEASNVEKAGLFYASLGRGSMEA